MSGGSSGGSGTGSSANVYEPAAQGTADYNWNQILQPLINQSANAGAGTPGGTYYPQAQRRPERDHATIPRMNTLPRRSRFSVGAVRGNQQSVAEDAGLLQNLTSASTLARP